MATNLDIAIRERLAGVETIDGTAYPLAAVAVATLAATLAREPRLPGPAGMVDKDGNPAAPAIYNGNRASAPVLPAVTFRASGGIPALPNTVESGIIDTVYYDFEFWDNADGGNGEYVGIIADAVATLLDCRKVDFSRYYPGTRVYWPAAPPLAMDNGRVFKASAFVGLVWNSDPQNEETFGLSRYAFVTQT